MQTEDDWNTWSTIERGDAYGYAKTKAEKRFGTMKNYVQKLMLLFHLIHRLY